MIVPIQPVSVSPGWDKDALTQFLENAQQNTLRALNQKFPAVEFLREIYDLYQRTRASTWADRLLPLFIARSQNAFGAACRVVLGGQVVETYPLLRASLEVSLYGFYVVNKQLHEVWLRHGESAAARQQVRKEFTIRKILDALSTSNAALAKRAKKLYDATVNHGGHPNAEGYLPTSQVSLRGVSVECLSPGTLPWMHAVQYTGKTAIVALRILEIDGEDRFRKCGVQPDLDRLDAEWGTIR